MPRSQRDQVAALLRAAPLDAGGELAVQRPMFEQFMAQTPLAPDVSLTERALGGVPSVQVDVPGTETGVAIIYFHGGVFALGSARASAGLASLIARATGVTVISVDYRLAPEHPYPAAVEDALAAYSGLLENVSGPDRIAIFGESAGGALALTTLIHARDCGLPQPAAAAMFSPWLDLTLSGASMQTKVEVDLTLSPEGLRRRVLDYAGDADPTTKALSPLFADLRGIAPLLLQTGSHEVLLDDSIRLAAAAAAADVAVQLDVTPGVPHVFQAFAGLLDESAAALRGAGSFLRSHLRAGT